MMTNHDEIERSSSGLSLAVRLRAGSLGAWRELVDLYGPIVDSWCRRAGLPESVRADIGQDVFLAVHRNIAQFDPTIPRATFRGWLWKITHNAVLQWLRTPAPNAPGGSTAMQQLAELPDPFASLSNGSVSDVPSTVDETVALLRRALEQIRPNVDPRTWQAFWKTAVLGKSATDVAVELGLSPASVRQAKSRLLRRLRQQLGDR